MATKLVLMDGEEFTAKLLAGERDFRRIKLEQGFDFTRHDSYSKIKDYLRKQDFSKNPIDISNSKLRYIIATGLYFQFLKAVNVDLTCADLRTTFFGQANLEKACLAGANLSENTNFWHANLFRADLSFTNLKDSKFYRADLEQATLLSADAQNADFLRANLSGTFLCGAKLTKADLRYANFLNSHAFRNDD